MLWMNQGKIPIGKLLQVRRWYRKLYSFYEVLQFWFEPYLQTPTAFTQQS